MQFWARITPVHEKFQQSEKPFCTANNHNFRDISFEKMGDMDAEILSLKLRWSFSGETGFCITMKMVIEN